MIASKSMSLQGVHEFTALIARAFDGAIEVNGDRIVAHKSGTLIVRTRGERRQAQSALGGVVDKDNDWTDV